jgi:ketosteroid isomerase-like protein
VSDPIAPPVARRPEEAPELVSLAVSDGDLGAALAQYEGGAPLRPWAHGSADGEGVHDTVLRIMDLRLPLTIRVLAVLPAAGLTLVLCERRIGGTGPDGQPVQLSGLGCTVVRSHQDGTWRIAADAWCLTDSDSVDQ